MAKSRAEVISKEKVAELCEKQGITVFKPEKIYNCLVACREKHRTSSTAHIQVSIHVIENFQDRFKRVFDFEKTIHDLYEEFLGEFRDANTERGGRQKFGDGEKNFRS